jgi:hypothetical protein
MVAETEEYVHVVYKAPKWSWFVNQLRVGNLECWEMFVLSLFVSASEHIMLKLMCALGGKSLKFMAAHV